ncbi:Lymphoid-specific helicase [Grifola frondosa]|uniref:Lymphoid-specific helicase n=1 Tax=Grifola frondosa TaxID=5627 RepID=A0A1C7MD58_GRIFR|nr:Lymphoid-specific helicase [Grifola frondosa]
MWYQNLGNETASSATAGSGKATRGRGRGGGRGKGHGKGRGGNNAGRRTEESDEDESEVEELVSPKRRGKATSRKSGRTPVKAKVLGSDDEDDSMGVDDRPSTSKSTAASSKFFPHQQTNFPVVITTYEIIIRDRAALSKYKWGFIVVDEGHRLKNIDCKLMREIKKIPAAARMVLTGTPLHNNLAELWALLNFVLPDLFGDLDAFQEWFNMHNLQAKLTSARSSQLIHSLHAVLRPFLLRRLKADVEMDLPPKKEYVLYTPLKVNKLDSKTGHKKDIDEEEEESVEVMEDKKGKGKARALRAKAKNYAEDEGDDEYFAHLEAGALLARKHKEPEKTAEEIGLEWHRKALMKKVNNMKLQNAVMQLRKVCSHPFLFDWPVDPDTLQPVVNEQLVNGSGKMMVLERLLDELFKRGHKVLLFSQFTTMLDIIEDWATEFKHWPITRIDGSTTMAERREEVRRFQESDDEPDAPRLFLLSTRAGGLGLNLVAADTVFSTIRTGTARLEGEKIQVVPNTAAGKASVISDEDLDVLLDRSPEVFVDRGKGWSSGEPVAGVPEVAEGAAVPGAKKTAFAVYEAPVHASSDVLGGIMSEDVDSD